MSRLGISRYRDRSFHQCVTDVLIPSSSARLRVRYRVQVKGSTKFNRNILDQVNHGYLAALFINFLATPNPQDKNTNGFVLDAGDDSKVANAIFPKITQYGASERLT